MKKLRVKKQFKKDRKKALKEPEKNTARLQSVIDVLLENEALGQEYKAHQLAGNWKPHWGCHIQPDFLLIYGFNEEADELILTRCGSHSELFG